MLEYQAVVCSLSEETLAASGVKRQFYFRTYISQKGLENNQKPVFLSQNANLAHVQSHRDLGSWVLVLFGNEVRNVAFMLFTLGK